MAKTKKTAEPTPKLSEAQQELKDLKAKINQEYLGEEEENPVEEKAKEITEDKVEEVVKDEEVKPVEEPTVEIDPDQLKEEVATKAKAEAVEAIEQKYNLTKKEAESVWEWEREGRNPKSYDELAENVTKVALARLEEKMRLQAEEQKAKEEEQKNQLEEYNKQLNTIWDEQIYTLRATGKLPKVANPKDENDEGLKTQKDFWAQLHHYNQERNKEGKPIVTNLIEFYTIGYKPPRKEVAGADAPIIGATAEVPPTNSETFSYEDIHNKGFHDLLH